MRVLLDTHAFLWALATPEQLSPTALSVLEQPKTKLAVSSVSFFEIATKSRLGKLHVAAGVLDRWEMVLSRLNAEPLLLSVGHAVRAGNWKVPHRDPFDRLLAAQASEERMALLTCDHVFHNWPGLEVLW